MFIWNNNESEYLMQRQNVSSSTIVSVGYDELALILEIEFKSGVYQYFEVPKSVYLALMSASSLGTYHAQYIKDVYTYRRI